jgi:hypothetical protein
MWPKSKPVLPAYAQAALKASEGLEPLPRFHAPPIKLNLVPSIRFEHPAWAPEAKDWHPAETAAA